ncbi:MAG: hypothetical protein WDM81_13945 [Rhizomicrobium sp.]
MFSDTAFFFQPTEPVTPGNIAMKRAEKIGVAAGVPVVECDGAPIMVSDAGQALEVVISDQGDRYNRQSPERAVAHT